MTHFGKMLSLYRAACGLTVRTLAPRIGVSYATLSRIEHGHPCDVTTFLKVCQWLFQEPAQEPAGTETEPPA